MCVRERRARAETMRLSNATTMQLPDTDNYDSVLPGIHDLAEGITGAPSDEQLFIIYFAGLVGWKLHPGYLRPGAQSPDLQSIAEIARQMVTITREQSCRG